MLQYHFTWKVLSAAAGITWWNFYFRLYRRTIRGAEVIDFLGHLLRHLPGRLVIVWDGLPAHRGYPVKEFIAAQRGRLARAAAGLRAGTQSGGVHLGLLEASRTAQLLPSRFRPTQSSRAPCPASHAAASTAGPLLLASGGFVTMICRPR